MANEQTGGVDHLQLSVSGTALPVGTIRHGPLIKGMWLKAAAGNTGNIYIGNSALVTSSTGIIVDKSVPILWPVENPASVFAISDGSNQTLFAWWA